MARLVSRAQLARLKAVSKPAITKACRGALEPACVRDRVDIDHPATRAYLGARWPEPGSDGAPPDLPKGSLGRQPKPTSSPKPARERRSDPTEERRSDGDVHPPPTDEELEALAAQLRPLLARFGTTRTFLDWLSAAKEIETIRGKRLANEETEGQLISRELVQTHVVGLLDDAFRRLLTDAAKTITRRLYGNAKSGVPAEDSEELVREILSSQLEPAKRGAAKQLRAPS